MPALGKSGTPRMSCLRSSMGRTDCHMPTSGPQQLRECKSFHLRHPIQANPSREIKTPTISWPHMSNPFRISVLFLCLAGGAAAQSTFGVAVGTVHDSSGAVVAGAAVRLTNLGENTWQETKTSSAGDYEFQNVKPGSYSVTVNHPGFRTFRSKGVTVVARQTLRVDASLEVGEVAETVEVEAQAGVIATDSPA